MAAARSKTTVMGRPKNPEEERLVSYGLHLSPDAKRKMTEIKDYEGVSVREWIENHIERDYIAMRQSQAAKRKENERSQRSS